MIEQSHDWSDEYKTLGFELARPRCHASRLGKRKLKRKHTNKHKHADELKIGAPAGSFWPAELEVTGRAADRGFVAANSNNNNNNGPARARSGPSCVLRLVSWGRGYCVCALSQV